MEDPQTYFVVCFHRPCVQEATDFVVESLAKRLEEGGAELIVRQEEFSEEKGGLILHVSATRQRLFQLAEAIGLKKLDLENGVIRLFNGDEADLFDAGGGGVVGPLTVADVHKCVLHAMESVHFDATHKALPGHPKVTHNFHLTAKV